MKSVTIIGILATAIVANAAVTIQFEVESLRDSNQLPVQDGTPWFLVADSNRDGIFPGEDALLNKTLASGVDIFGDRVFASGTTNSAEGNLGRANISATFSIVSDLGFSEDGEQVNQKWAIYWFPGLASINSNIEAGQSFGRFHGEVVDSGSGGDSAMIFQAAPSLTTTLYFDSEVLSDFDTPTANTPSVSDFSANFTVIPEPSSVGLALLGVLGLMARRRR